MPSLRRLELRLRHPGLGGTTIIVESPIKTENIFRLSNLTYFHLSGYEAHIEGLLAGLVAPSLQDLSINLKWEFYTVHFPHISRFIRAIERPVFAAKVRFGIIALLISMLHSIDGLSFKLNYGPDVEDWVGQMKGTLGVTLRTVEDVLLTCPVGRHDNSFRFWPIYHLPWREFLEQFPNAKILRLRRGIVLATLRFLRGDDGEAPALDLLPALEEIELHAADHLELADKRQRTAVLDSFGPFLAAR
ncbi:hypothetical protein BJV78DRAFT_464788 [Lactifluus subvellereus]|nr:hypothetical protein BJV78DRAFT_464788 [Lactifluus subvellereus]